MSHLFIIIGRFFYTPREIGHPLGSHIPVSVILGSQAYCTQNTMFVVGGGRMVDTSLWLI